MRCFPLLALAVGFSLSSFPQAADMSPAPAPAVMFRGNAQHTGTYAGPGANAFHLKWRFKTAGKIRSSPVYAAGIVLVGSEDGNLYAVDAKNGNKIWKVFTGGDLSSSPAVANDVVFVLGGDGRLWALELATGKLKWVFEPGKDIPLRGDPRAWDYFLSSPTIDDGVLFFGSGDGHIYAVDQTTGAVKWKYLTGARVRTTPAVSGGTVFAGSFDGAMYALDRATGNLKWKHQTGAPVQSSPSIAGDVVLFGSRDMKFRAVDARTGALRWSQEHPSSWIVGSPAVTGNLAVVGSSDAQIVQAVAWDTGKEVWRVKLNSRTLGSVAIADGLAFVGLSEGQIRALDLKDGRNRGTGFTEAAINSSPILHDGVLFVGCDDDYLYAFTGKPKVHHRVPLSAEQLKAMTGRFEIRPGKVAEVSPTSDGLKIHISGQDLVFFPEGPLDFFFEEADITIHFTTDPTGRVSGAQLTQGTETISLKRLPD